jgi:hypothetical protein
MSTSVLERPISRIRGISWTGEKRVALSGQVGGDATVGEVAEKLRERMQLPRRSYAVYHENRKLNRSATLAEAELTDDVELELAPEIKAG